MPERRAPKRGRPIKPDTTPPGHWATRAEAMQGILEATGQQVSVSSLNAWSLLPGCPIPVGGGPIPQEALLAWVANHFAAKERPADPERELRAKLLAHKLAKLDGQSISVAAVEADVASASAILHRVLIDEAPARLHAACVGKPFDAAQEDLRAILTECVNAFAAECLTTAHRETDE